MVHVCESSKDYSQVSVSFIYFFIYMFTEVQRLVNNNTKVFFTRYFLYFNCFMTFVHGLSCWVRFKANMKVFALFKVKQHFPYICPCYCLVYTVLDLFNMLMICYTSIKFCIIRKQFHHNRYNVRHVIDKNQKENSPFLLYSLVPSFKKSISEMQVTTNPPDGGSGYLFFQY